MSIKKQQIDKGNVFGATDYKTYLASVLLANPGIRGLQSKLAEAAGCQRAYLSRVLHGKPHLTPEHACGIARLLGMSVGETDFMLDLLSMGRTDDDRLRARYRSRLRAIKQANENLSSRFGVAAFPAGEKEMLYYSSWHWSAIHVATSLSGLSSGKAIAERLGLPRATVESSLQALERQGIVERRAVGGWKPSGGHVHVPRDSAMCSMNHSNWRQRAVLDSYAPDHDGVHYTVVQSHSRKDFAVIKDRLLAVIDELRATVEPSPEEELTAVCLDFFKV